MSEVGRDHDGNTQLTATPSYFSCLKEDRPQQSYHTWTYYPDLTLSNLTLSDLTSSDLSLSDLYL